MKILNWNLETQEFTISRQKHKEIDNIVKTLAECEAVINIYECDLFYKNNCVLDIFKALFMKYQSLVAINQNFINNIPKKTIKNNCMGLSMDIQDYMVKLYTEINKINTNEFDINNTNHIVIAALANESMEQAIHKYLDSHQNEAINYNMFKKDFLDKYPNAQKRQCIMLANKVDFSKMFNNIANPQKYKFALNNDQLMHRKGYLSLQESTNIPILVNDLLSYSIWGFHLFYEQKYLKYFIFYCFNDIIIFSYRKNSSGLSKLDFYVAIPNMYNESIDKNNLDLEEYNSYIHNFIDSYVLNHQQLSNF